MNNSTFHWMWFFLLMEKNLSLLLLLLFVLSVCLSVFKWCVACLNKYLFLTGGMHSYLSRIFPPGTVSKSIRIEIPPILRLRLRLRLCLRLCLRLIHPLLLKQQQQQRSVAQIKHNNKNIIKYRGKKCDMNKKKKSNNNKKKVEAWGSRDLSEEPDFVQRPGICYCT